MFYTEDGLLASPIIMPRYKQLDGELWRTILIIYSGVAFLPRQIIKFFFNLYIQFIFIINKIQQFIDE